MRKMELWGLLLLVIAVLLFWCYNTIPKKEEAVFAAWGDVEAACQRRLDLIPNLVETVKAYAAHEKETLQAITEARATVGKVQISAKDLDDPAAVQKFNEAQGSMTSALSRLLVVAERYPELKANQNFLDLQPQLEGTENRINVARQRYNEAVRIFNTSIRTFPNNLTNKLFFHLKRKEPFKAQEGASSAPSVKF